MLVIRKVIIHPVNTTNVSLLEALVGPPLVKKGFYLVIAESCTGGLIGHRLTNIPGCSDYYLGSITAYAYEAKERLLGVSREALTQYGAVSREIVIAMASGARKIFAGEHPLERIIGLSVSGIAGPGGGMPGKPVGLVWIGLSTPDGNWAQKHCWEGNRIQNKEYSAEAAIHFLYDYLLGFKNREHSTGYDLREG